MIRALHSGLRQMLDIDVLDMRVVSGEGFLWCLTSLKSHNLDECDTAGTPAFGGVGFTAKLTQNLIADGMVWYNNPAIDYASPCT